MRIEIVTIGTELLLGFTIDGNAAVLGQVLADQGIEVARRATVPDEPAAIRDAVGEGLARTGTVITTGGLGPTRDDITREVVAELFGRQLEFREDVWQEVVARFARFGRVPNDANRSQALVPEGAKALPNRWGTAPGIWLEGPTTIRPAGGLVVMLPGVPHEMRMLLEREVVPRLADRPGHGGVIRSWVVRTFGVPESTLAERLEGVDELIAPLTLAYLPGAGSVDLRVTAWHLPADEADGQLERAQALVRERAGPGVYGTGEADLAALVLEGARRRGWRIATAESCTAGMVASRLTDIPGSSDVVLGGVVAYDNALKERLLNVDPGLLARAGAVSEETALAMAAGALQLGADLGVAVTGIAGPGGGTPEKPVGTVWLATASPEGSKVTCRRFQGDRATIRLRATDAALALLLQATDPGFLPG